MLEARAVVVHTDKSITLVKVNQGSGCEQCNWQGCGSGKLAQLFCSKPRQFEVTNSIDAKVGDNVVISVAEGAVLRGIGLVYLLPLSLLMAGVMLASLMTSEAHQDVYIAIGAISGLAFGLLLTRWIAARRAGRQAQPYITQLCHEKWGN